MQGQNTIIFSSDAVYELGGRIVGIVIHQNDLQFFRRIIQCAPELESPEQSAEPEYIHKWDAEMLSAGIPKSAGTIQDRIAQATE